MAKTFSKLTRVAMRRLPIKGTISEHGISFSRAAAGDGVFTVNIMVDGQRIHRVVGKRVGRDDRTRRRNTLNASAKTRRTTAWCSRKDGRWRWIFRRLRCDTLTSCRELMARTWIRSGDAWSCIWFHSSGNCRSQKSIRSASNDIRRSGRTSRRCAVAFAAGQM